MKAAWMIGTVLAALVAGAGGGFVAMEFLSQQSSGPTKVDVAQIEPEAEDAPSDNSADTSDLEAKLAALEVRLGKAEDAAKDDGSAAEIAALKARIEELEKQPAAPVVTTDEEGNPVASADPESDAFKAAVNKAIEEREAQERAEREQQREEWMKQRMEDEKERIVTTMTEKLALTPLQQENIKVILDNYNTKRQELMTKGMEARRNGEEFDWETERATIETDTKTAIEAELTLSQVSSFQELVGDQEVDDIGEEGGRRRGGFGGGPGRGR